MFRRDGLKISAATCGIVFLPLGIAHVHNYIDPATGSIIIQVAIATLAGGIYVAKNYWLRIKGFFSKSDVSAKKDDKSENGRA